MQTMLQTGRAQLAKCSPPAALGPQRSLGAGPAPNSSGWAACGRTPAFAQGAFCLVVSV